MAVQNQYNNYMKRQKPMNNFKEKVKNSLGGVPVQKTQGTSAGTTINTPPIAPRAMQNNVPTNNPNTPKPPVTQTPVAPPTTPVQNGAPTPPVPAPQNPVVPPVEGENQGLISSSEVNDAFTQPGQAIDSVNPEQPPMATPVSVEEVNQLANNPDVQKQAYAEKKTPQQMAQELLEAQKAQLQKDWELKQEQLKAQQEQAEKQYQASLAETDKKFGETIDVINQNRYDNQQNLNVSGTNRGIQYSPQQLGLENVANINSNKNVTEAGKQRNELLTKLQEQINQINADLLMGSQNSVNEYNKALAGLQSDYANKIMDWEWSSNQTEEERKWQESQTQKDREWQEMMDKADKEWQANQNKLDRDKQKSGRSGYSGGNSWKNYGGWQNYGGRGWQDWSKGSYGMNGYDSNWTDYDMNDKDYQDAYVKNVLESSTDMYNALGTGGMGDLNERADIYTSEIDNMLKDAKKQGMPESKLRELQIKRDTALRQMNNKSFARDTNGEYKIGETVYQNRTPVRDEHVRKTQLFKEEDRRDYRERYNVEMSNSRPIGSNAVSDRFKKDMYNKHEQVIKKHSDQKNKPKSQKSNKVNDKVINDYKAQKNKQSENVKKASEKNKKTVEKVKKSVSKSKSNAKKSVSKSKSNAKTSGSKSNSNSNKATKNSAKNFKNNVKKAVSKVTSKFKKKK